MYKVKHGHTHLLVSLPTALKYPPAWPLLTCWTSPLFDNNTLSPISAACMTMDMEPPTGEKIYYSGHNLRGNSTLFPRS